MGIHTTRRELAIPDPLPLYLFLHIHKTAGTTLKANFQLNFGSAEWLFINPRKLYGKDDKSVGSLANPGWVRERVEEYVAQQGSVHTRCIFGHMVHYGLHHCFTPPREPRYITFLRHPVERAISQYFYLRDHSANYWHDEIIAHNWTLAEWFDKTPALWVRNGTIRLLLLADYEEVSTERELTRVHLEAAKQRLDRFWFVGLTEQFELDADYLYGRLGFRRFSQNGRLMATAKKEPVPLTVREQIAAANELDMELYEYARQKRRQFLSRHAGHYAWLILRTRIRKWRYGRIQVQDPIKAPKAGEGKDERSTQA